MAYPSLGAGEMEDSSWWGRAFEPFYGNDYCLRVTMDLEKLRDEKYQGNTFQFQEGWVKPTVELLNRLRNMGFPARTKDYILIHLSCPLESMAYGELYFQAGRQIPGRLSLKFTRRQPDGNVVIQPTVLKCEEEQKLAFTPCQYLASLRDHARISQPDPQRILTILILLNAGCERQRVNASAFLQALNEPMNIWHPAVPQPIPRYMFNAPEQVLAHPIYPHEAMNSFPIGCPRTPTTPILTGRPFRSASQGNILHYNNTSTQNEVNVPRISIPATVPGRTENEPVENDETSQLGSSGSFSNGSQEVTNGCQTKQSETSRKHPPRLENVSSPNVNKQSASCNAKSMLAVEEYVDTAHAMKGDVEATRRFSNDSGSGRTSVKDEYKIMTNALSSLSIGNSTPSEDLDTHPLTAFANTNMTPRKQSLHDSSPNGAVPFTMLPNISLIQGISAARSPMSNVHSWLQHCPSLNNTDSLSRTIAEEEYTGTVQAMQGSCIGQESWLPHHGTQDFSSANYRFNNTQYPLLSMDRPSLLLPSVSGQPPMMIPLTVEELNNTLAQQQSRYNVNARP